MRWLDTAESWHAMLEAWDCVYAAAGASSEDRAFFAFSFGPFLGFWTAFESAQKRGMFCLSGGGMTTETRIKALVDHQCSILCCTPTYALRLAQVAAEQGFRRTCLKPLLWLESRQSSGCPIQIAGSLGAWDHHGAEVGPVSYECPEHPCTLHVIQDAFHCEVLEPASDDAVAPGQQGELILTTLSRIGSPLIRYRTGDLVRAPEPGLCRCGSEDPRLEGGILGRCDDMVVVRGVNIYPSAIDQIVRSQATIAEYQVEVFTKDHLTELKVIIEPIASLQPDEVPRLASELARDFQVSLALRVPVEVAQPGTLPRFEMKAKRWNRR